MEVERKVNLFYFWDFWRNSSMLYHIYLMSLINLPNIFNYEAQKSPSTQSCNALYLMKHHQKEKTKWWNIFAHLPCRKRPKNIKKAVAFKQCLSLEHFKKWIREAFKIKKKSIYTFYFENNPCVYYSISNKKYFNEKHFLIQPFSRSSISGKWKKKLKTIFF